MTAATKLPPASVRTTYRSVFGVGEFRLLFAGQLMYVLGTEFEILGLSVLVYAQTRSALLAALAFSMGFAPQVVGGMLFTSLADRLPPRTVITTGLLIRAAPGLLIGLAPGLPVAVMLGLVAVAAMAAPVFNAAISALLADVLDGDRFIVGRSIMSLTSAGGQILGLGISGAILALLPARRLLLVAGCALVLSSLIRLGLRSRPPRAAVARDAGRPGGKKARGTVHATLAGNARLFADPVIRGLLLAQWLPCSCVVGAESLIVPYTHALGHPASTAGPLLAAMPTGMLVSDMVVGRFCRAATRERLAFPLAVLLGVPMLAFAFRLPLPIVAGLLFVSALGFGYMLGIQQAFLDSVPSSLRGQAFGLNSTGLMSGQGLLPSIAGAVAMGVGAGPGMALAGLATVLAALALRHRLTPAAEPRPPSGPAESRPPR
ncbi:MAG: MFS transporter [Streptosporangiaceae bacterium]|nr:MFS transporter [Streptosporangiaceae bacterium]